MTNTYSVTQFFSDGVWEMIRRDVSAEDAIKTFATYTRNPAAMIGLTKRVIVTDSGDCINAEWRYGEGIVYPVRR